MSVSIVHMSQWEWEGGNGREGGREGGRESVLCMCT